MNIKVNQIISNYLQELLQINPRSNCKNLFGDYYSNKSVGQGQNRGRFGLDRDGNVNQELNISSDYRLLQKSIEKLKNM